VSLKSISEKGVLLLAENRIREALEEGAFDHLEGQGRPLPDLDEPYDPNWWIKKWMCRERLSKEVEVGSRVKRGLIDIR